LEVISDNNKEAAKYAEEESETCNEEKNEEKVA